MCRLLYRDGATLVWAKTEEDVEDHGPRLPILRASSTARHCGMRMLVTETLLLCRAARCGHVENRCVPVAQMERAADS